MSQKNFNPSIHGLRGFAALSVVLFHVLASGVDDHFLPAYVPQLLETAFTSLRHGVELFFMISGYLIAFSILNHRNIGHFLKNRCIRIYPAFMPILLMIFVLGPFAGYDYFNSVHSFGQWLALFIANLLFLPGIFPIEPALLVAWTLSFEAAFYIFCALSYLTYRTWPMPTTKGLIVLAAMIACYFQPLSMFFAIGAGTYFFYDQLGKTDTITSRLSIIYLIVFFAGMMSLPTSLNLLIYIPLFALTYLTAILLFVGVARQKGEFSYFLNKPMFQFLGTISYSLYLWHTPIMFATKRISLKLFSDFGDTAVFLSFGLSSLLICFPVAWISYIIFEKHIPDLIKKHEH